MFTTRPEIRGTFGVVASTHWIASGVGMSMLERGGNAFDAAVAIGFVLQIVEPHLCGPAGEVPIIFRSARDDKPTVLCGQGVAPAAATIERMRSMNLQMVPGSGLIAAVVPGSFDAWMTLLRDHGSMRLSDVLEPAIHYAEAGHPLLPGVSRALADVADAFRKEWPTSAPVWLPNNEVPAPNQLFRNPMLAATWRRILDAAGDGTREQQIERARAAWSSGFVAEAIDRFCRTQELMDASGQRHKGLLTGDDMARWQATYEPPQTFRYGEWTFSKTGPWGQGPVLLQALSLLAGFDLEKMPASEPEFVHVVLEALKLAFADREAYYGDPDFTRVPLDILLSQSYAAERRKLIGDRASLELRPGVVPGFEAQIEKCLSTVRIATNESAGLGIGEPTMMHLKPTLKPGDTVHFDVIDRFGNMVSATPSGGWPQSSPTIPELGFALNTRAQMFWLEPGLPGSLAPGKRPRTTLTPTLAVRDDGMSLICGTPGGDQQDQWQLILLLRYIHHGLGLQQAIDAPLFHSVHFPASFYPREALLGTAVFEESCGEKVIAELRRRGHKVKIAPEWSAGRLTAAARGPDGILHAAATPRLMQAYALGR
ncbi:gamma-glutamyltransferase family protein [Steroidobacter sp. S1-65]|uniref:Gamma-glutamyltransferase family protein n=1 Tax=Steroidobacter gossypii TaxID=2805490 RepID=A0ABS1WTU4_9GAMM|nr:gamma-glutamyltransferase family protein [Steroidobacter gossypii]MBM0104395.1 gamma-glutamyltransferase family protein [Steroidobacter gossypii]